MPALNTIRGAQQVLVDEGMLETRQGVGAFVIAADSLGELDVTATLAQARDSLTTVLAALEAKVSQQVVIESAGGAPGHHQIRGAAPRGGEVGALARLGGGGRAHQQPDPPAAARGARIHPGRPTRPRTL